MIVLFNEMREFYYELQPTLSANLRYCITADLSSPYTDKTEKEIFLIVI
jgi:hypothetical protein